MKTNYFKIGLYIVGTVVVIAAVFMIIRAFGRAKQGVSSIGDIIQDNKVNTDIAQAAGLPVQEVDNSRKIASDLATELELRKGMTWWERQKGIVTDSELLDIASQIKSAAQMRVVAAIFQNELTYNKNLYTELKRELSGSNLSKVPFVETILK